MRMGAVTHFEGGGSWRTACPGVLGGVPPVPGHGRADLLSVGPGELLERHAAYVDAFARENGVAPKGVTLAELAQVNATYERAALPKMGMGQMASLPISMGAICLFLGGLALVRSGEARIGALGGAVFMGLFYLVIRHGVLNIARGHVARHMHTRAFQLEQTAVAADGTIATGRYERWLRLLAVVAALDVAARLVVIAWKIVQNFPFSGGGAFVFAALIVALNVIVLRELVARAKGRVVTLGAKPSSVGAWSSWSTAALLFSVGVRTMPHVLMGWLVVVFVLSVLGRALEKRGRT
jgi:hypothetical protein